MKQTTFCLLLCLLSACSSHPPSTPNTTTASPSGAQTSPSQDLALKAQLAAVLSELEPGIQEKSAVSALALEQAQQLAQDPADTGFKLLQQRYEPLPPSALTQRLLRQEIYATDNLVSAFLSDGNPEQLLQRFRSQIGPAVGRTPFSHYGLAVVRRGQAWFVSLVLLTEIVRLNGLELTPQPTGGLSIRGAVTLPGYDKPHVLLTLPDGRVIDVETQVSGQEFSASLPLEQPGLYSFEVDVEGPLGPMPACNFVLAVGQPYPAPENGQSVSDIPASADAARQEMLELVNQDRQAMGLNQLQLDARLNQSAQAHSDDMVQNSFLGHNSPTQGTPQQQAFLFQVSDLVAQNISVSRSLKNAQRELMSSPGHRRTLLDPAHTHAGFGVTTGQDGFLYLTQNFIQRKLEVEALPTTAQPNQTLEVRGRRLEPGFVAVFIGNDVQGEPVDLTQNERFQIPVRLNQTGPVRLRIGFSGPPQGNTFNFTFYNIWDLEVKP